MAFGHSRKSHRPLTRHIQYSGMSNLPVPTSHIHDDADLISTCHNLFDGTPLNPSLTRLQYIFHADDLFQNVSNLASWRGRAFLTTDEELEHRPFDQRDGLSTLLRARCPADGFQGWKAFVGPDRTAARRLEAHIQSVADGSEEVRHGWACR